MSNPVEEKRPDERLGEYIARVREARGMSLEDLSAVTKLTVSNLKAIESSDWKSFPVPAYVRGYLNSISAKLNLDAQAVLQCYAAEMGQKPSKQFVDVSTHGKIAPVTEDETKKKSMAVPVVIVVLILAFLVASHFLDLESIAEQNSSPAPVNEAPAVVAEDSTEQAEVPEGAEVVPADSLQKDTAVTDTAKVPESAVSQAVVDEAVKKSELPASATIFISSDSKKVEKAAENAPKTNKTNFVLVGSGEALSWVGLKRREDSSSFLKEANIARKDVRMVYNTEDTLCVTIGEPKAIAKLLLNGVETPLPEMQFGRVTRFRVFGGKIVK
ncbi:MAG: helix-turn-helix domain-containing protein [Fibrobacter sp.]|nr:helix-turn-helix domain-containing protein [Fibrobacter sp.]